MSGEQSDDEAFKAVEKILGEPAAAEFSDAVWRIRNHLMIASVIAIAVVLGDLHIDPGSTIVGLKFSGLNDRVLRGALLLVESYLLIHFLWAAFDGVLAWRLRVTGT